MLSFGKNIIFLALIFHFQISALSQARPMPTYDPVIKESLYRILGSGLEYLKVQQQQETYVPYYYSGEWPSYMEMQIHFPFLGRNGKRSYDSNCFTNAHIHAILAEIYLDRPEFEFIAPMLNASIENILRYRTENGFGFWQFIPVRYGIGNVYFEVLARGPNHFKVNTPFLKLSGHVPEDADDTSISYLALLLQKKASEKYMSVDPPSWFPQNPTLPFDHHLDRNRKNIHFYNTMFMPRMTRGAYLTWFQDEKPLSLFTFIPEVGNPNIPWGSNEVDCVVNANVIATLAAFRNKHSAGYLPAVELVKENIYNRNFAESTLYYPLRYQLHYATAKAIYYGAEELIPAVDAIIDDLAEHQQEGGYFLNRNGRDTLQSTAFAVLTLLYLKPFSTADNSDMIDEGFNYLMAQRKMKNGYTWWPGGVFFSGGTIIKDELIWRSSAYTTALVLEAINIYLEENILKITTGAH